MKLAVAGVLYTAALLAGAFGISVGVTEWRGADVRQAEVDQAVQQALDERWDMFEMTRKLEFLNEATELAKQIKTGDTVLALCMEKWLDRFESLPTADEEMGRALVSLCKPLADGAEKQVAEE